MAYFDAREGYGLTTEKTVRQQFYVSNTNQSPVYLTECPPLFIQFSGCESILTTVSVDSSEGPPVPIPNTEVKLAYANDTRLATARENR